MFNVGFTELLVLGVIALIFIGPDQLPELARTLGRLLNEWKRATSDFQSSLTTHITTDVRDRWQENRENMHDGPDHVGAPEPTVFAAPDHPATPAASLVHDDVLHDEHSAVADGSDDTPAEMPPEDPRRGQRS